MSNSYYESPKGTYATLAHQYYILSFLCVTIIRVIGMVMVKKQQNFWSSKNQAVSVPLVATKQTTPTMDFKPSVSVLFGHYSLPW